MSTSIHTGESNRLKSLEEIKDDLYSESINESLDAQIEIIMILCKRLMNELGRLDQLTSRRLSDERVQDIEEMNKNTKGSWETAIKLTGASLMLLGAGLQLVPGETFKSGLESTLDPIGGKWLASGLNAAQVPQAINSATQGGSQIVTLTADPVAKDVQVKNNVCNLRSDLHKTQSGDFQSKQQSSKQVEQQLMQTIKELVRQKHEVLVNIFRNL